MVTCPHAHIEHEHNRDGDHTCLDCGGDVSCERAGPDVCEYEAVRAERTDLICAWLRIRAEKKRLAGRRMQGQALKEAATDIEAGKDP